MRFRRCLCRSLERQRIFFIPADGGSESGGFHRNIHQSDLLLLTDVIEELCVKCIKIVYFFFSFPSAALLEQLLTTQSLSDLCSAPPWRWMSVRTEQIFSCCRQTHPLTVSSSVTLRPSLLHFLWRTTTADENLRCAAARPAHRLCGCSKSGPGAQVWPLMCLFLVRVNETFVLILCSLFPGHFSCSFCFCWHAVKYFFFFWLNVTVTVPVLALGCCLC